jgi:acylphosphatase
MAKQRLHAYISGRVQGVGFRSFTRRNAKEIGLTGWVKNLPDGRVETVAEGREREIEKFIDKLKEGPSGSKVEALDINKKDYEGSFSEFKVTY